MKRVEYQKKLKQTTLQTFKDRPDEVKEIYVDYAEDTVVGISFEEPSSNNSPITQFHIYLS